MADFNRKKKNSTSISNTELDNWLRGLKPRLAVKVIDACNSGYFYVKSVDKREKIKSIFDSSGNHFENCYFMYSSSNTQYSYQDSDMSGFTRAFIDAVASSTGDKILYAEIIAYIRDQFNGDLDQTPQFVIQSPFTEEFCI